MKPPYRSSNNFLCALRGVPSSECVRATEAVADQQLLLGLLVVRGRMMDSQRPERLSSIPVMTEFVRLPFVILVTTLISLHTSWPVSNVSSLPNYLDLYY